VKKKSKFGKAYKKVSRGANFWINGLTTWWIE